MLFSIVMLIIGIALILFASQVFCNAIEHLGSKLGLSEGVTGSLFVAVGTALPETIIPIVAVFGLSQASAAGHEIGIGAILGAPLMLSTLSLCLIGFFGAVKRSGRDKIKVEPVGMLRDLNFFLFGYSLAILLGIISHWYDSNLLKILVCAILAVTYFIYVLSTIKASKALVADGHGVEAHDPLLLTKWLKLPHNLFIIVFQVLLGLGSLVYFAHFFVEQIENFATLSGISSFIVSLVIVPIATELPEKFNSIMWIRKGKDTLAMSNVTGALTFQGVLLPIFGIMATRWVLDFDRIISVVCPILSVIWLRYCVKNSKLTLHNIIILGLLYIGALISMVAI